jgi:hypothetical protein
MHTQPTRPAASHLHRSGRPARTGLHAPGRPRRVGFAFPTVREVPRPPAREPSATW